MKLGSLFAGIGGLDLACEWALGCETVWQLDQVNDDIRRRHWSHALQIAADVRAIDPASLPAVDVLSSGFSCKDISVAGSHSLLDGDNSGPTYRRTLEFVDVLRPAIVVLENVPRLFSRLREVVERDFGVRGYELMWIRIAASDVGAPHLRRRVFVVARRGGPSGVIEMAEQPPAFRLWPTPTAGDAKSSGSRTSDHNNAHAGTSLTDAIRPDRIRRWATPATDYKGGRDGQRRGQLIDQLRGNGRLNPDWIETLMGFPIGWTRPDNGMTLPGFGWPGSETLTPQRRPKWPRGRYPKDWDRSTRWDGFEWEPARLLDGQSDERNRRIEALGNAVVPQQGYAAIRAAVGGACGV